MDLELNRNAYKVKYSSSDNLLKIVKNLFTSKTLDDLINECEGRVDTSSNVEIYDVFGSMFKVLLSSSIKYGINKDELSYNAEKFMVLPAFLDKLVDGETSPIKYITFNGGKKALVTATRFDNGYLIVSPFGVRTNSADMGLCLNVNSVNAYKIVNEMVDYSFKNKGLANDLCVRVATNPNFVKQIEFLVNSDNYAQTIKFIDDLVQSKPYLFANGNSKVEIYSKISPYLYADYGCETYEADKLPFYLAIKDLKNERISTAVSSIDITKKLLKTDGTKLSLEEFLYNNFVYDIKNACKKHIEIAKSNAQYFTEYHKNIAIFYKHLKTALDSGEITLINEIKDACKTYLQDIKNGKLDSEFVINVKSAVPYIEVGDIDSEATAQRMRKLKYDGYCYLPCKVSTNVGAKIAKMFAVEQKIGDGLDFVSLQSYFVGHNVDLTGNTTKAKATYTSSKKAEMNKQSKQKSGSESESKVKVESKQKSEDKRKNRSESKSSKYGEKQPKQKDTFKSKEAGRNKTTNNANDLKNAKTNKQNGFKVADDNSGRNFEL